MTYVSQFFRLFFIFIYGLVFSFFVLFNYFCFFDLEVVSERFCQQPKNKFFSLAYRSVINPNHVLHQLVVGLTSVQGERSRQPFVPTTRELLSGLSKRISVQHNG